MKGRKPKAIEQRAREGNPGKRKLPAPVKLPESTLTRPDDLPAEAASLWDDVVCQLEAARVVHRVDRAALTALCIQWARAHTAGKVIAQEGHFAFGSTGQLVEHPALAIERNAHAMFLRFAEQYGLTAAARARIAAALSDRPPEDELERILDADAIEV